MSLFLFVYCGEPLQTVAIYIPGTQNRFEKKSSIENDNVV